MGDDGKGDYNDDAHDDGNGYNDVFTATQKNHNLGFSSSSNKNKTVRKGSPVKNK